ncbi:hypothetical protein MATL_G00261600 [Megalops atlanticus]|uniref:Uncharacterized protein n=1 Tax=Megalops atlanticus TaxID=7932 RepID=A0A9D3PCG3_MEGAT|nr:hypothetical protein MATL_G00261600 [Megalops atlanticus]
MEETEEKPQALVAEPVNDEQKRQTGSKKRKSSVCSPESNNTKRPPLRRGSSFSFLTPGSQWDFTLKRKRREKDDDTVSMCSFDFKVRTD